MTKQVSAQISDVEDTKINILIKQGHFLNRADFTRNAVKSYLKDFSFPELPEAKP